MSASAIHDAEAVEQALDALYPLAGNDARLLATGVIAGDITHIPIGEQLRLRLLELIERAPVGGIAVVRDIGERMDARELLVDQLAFEGRRAASEWASLDGINEALSAAVRVFDGDRIFDPCFGTAGTLLAATTRSRTVSFAGFELNTEAHARGSLRVAARGFDATNLIADDFARANLAACGLEGSCDVVVSDLPFGMPFRPESHGLEWPADIRLKTFEWFAMHKALSVLRPGGRFAFVVPRTILGNERDARVRRWFFERANVTHLIALPSGVLGRSSAPAAIIAGNVREGEQDFVELIAVPRTGSATQSQQLSVAEALERADDYMARAADDQAYEIPGEWAVRPTGTLLEDPEDPLDFTSELAWLEQGALSGELANAFPEGLRRLGDVADIRRGDSTHARREIAALLASDPSKCCIEITTKGSVQRWDPADEDTKSALLVTVAADEFASGFLEWFLRSRFGRLQRSMLASGIARPQLTPRHAGDILVPGTNVEGQIAIVSCAQALDVQAIQLEQWRAQLDANPHASMPHILDRLSPTPRATTDVLTILPYPLAMAYRRADVEQNLHAQHKALVQVLEAISQFVAIVSWSILYRDEELREQHQEKWKGGTGSRKPTFVTWIDLGRSLAKIARNVRSVEPRRWNSIAGTDDPALADVLASKQMFKLFDEARLHRNAWDGHIGHVPQDKLLELTSELRRILNTLFTVFGDIWTKHRLVRARDGWREDEHDVQNFDLLTGAVQPFAPLNEVRVSELIRRNRLCLLSPESRHPIELIPMMQMEMAPPTDKGTAYFFSRVDELGPRFITYQPDGEAEWRPEQPNPDLERALDWLDSQSPR